MKGIIVVNPFLVPKESLHFASRLEDEFNKRGVQIEIISNLFATTCLDESKLKAPFNGVDFCVYLDKDKYQSQILEKVGINLFNCHNAIRLCDDKAETYIALADSGVNLPKTVFGALCYNKDAVIDDSWLDDVIDKLSLPIIVKESFGSMGKGVYLAHDKQELSQITEQIKLKPYIYQQYIGAKKGLDVRVIVIGGKAKCAILRENQNDFRSNVAQGGSATAFELPKAFNDTAEKCAKVLGLDYCGVDLLFDANDNPIVCEVNSNAFIGGIEGATGFNVAGAYADYIIEKLK